MSTAVAPLTCACGCGNAVSGRKYLNARHKQQHEASQTYPRPIAEGIRLNKCERHGREFLQFTPPKPERGSVFAGVIQLWAGFCEDCDKEERERIEALKPKPISEEARRLDDMILTQQRKLGFREGFFVCRFDPEPRRF